MANRLKEYSTIGCCGIDCGLCPRFHTKSDSACPGCGGSDFKNKHPSCGFVTCCAIKKGFEVCSDCKDYPCSRFDSEKNGYDSFVTHKKVFTNLELIKAKGIDYFIVQQKIKIEVLTDFLNMCDDGRSKSFFCISCALLPVDKLQDSRRLLISWGDSIELKQKNKQLKDYLQMIAKDLQIDLRLNNKK